MVPTGTTPPTQCLPTNPACTTHPVPALVVTKSAVPVSTTPVAEGQVLTYTLTFANTAGRAPATVNHTDDLSRVLDDATVTTAPALASGSGLTVGAISGGVFTITGTVPAGTTATVTFAVTVNTPDTGDHQLDNFVVPTGTPPPAQCLPTNPACTTHPVPALVVTKSAVPASTTPVAEGQVLTYTLTFSNTAGQAPATVNHTDDLSRVLDDATVTTPPALASGSGLTVGAITGGAFTVTGTIAAGATATVTFAVTVNTPDTGDHQLDNFVVPTGTTPPAQCLPTNPACTTHPVPALVVTKSAVPASTTTVNEGNVVAYTLTFANTAGRAPATVNYTDDLSRVLDDATVTIPPALATGAGLTVGTITAGAFTVTGTIAAGATATVTFSVMVNTPDTGDHQLDNFVVPTGTHAAVGVFAGEYGVYDASGAGTGRHEVVVTRVDDAGRRRAGVDVHVDVREHRGSSAGARELHRQSVPGARRRDGDLPARARLGRGLDRRHDLGRRVLDHGHRRRRGDGDGDVQCHREHAGYG